VDAAKAAEGIAGEAKSIANATGQHFWDDDGGAHVTDVTRDEWAAAVEDDFGDYDPDAKPYHNQLLNSMGILLRTALNNLVSITRSAIAFYDGAGNSASNIVARFGSDGAQIGVADGAHSYLAQDYHSLQMVDKEGNDYLYVSDLRDDTGEATITEHGYTVTQGSTYYVALSVVSVVSATYIDMQLTVASIDGNAITFEQTMYPGRELTVVYTTTDARAKAYTLGVSRHGDIGPMSVAEGIGSEASGMASHAEGQGTFASGSYSHAEGQATAAEGIHSHAEGHWCWASGVASHAEGMSSHATGRVSHAEGTNTEATGDYSHAQNNYTVAASADQTAMGKFNVRDANDTYALIIGNGTGEKARSNALAVTWDGSTIAQGWAGVIQMFAGSTPPAGWLLCDGSAVSRTEYAVLYAAIGDTWGAGDGSTTFNLPDLRGRAPIGAGHGSGLTNRTLGGNVGSETHTLNANQIPAHTHGSKTLTGGFRVRHYGTSGDGAQLVFTPSGIVDVDAKTGTLGKVNAAGVGSNGGYEQVTVNATHTHDSVGGGQAHNNMQPSAVVNFIIHTGKTS
jgi:microcystin-dependent protein